MKATKALTLVLLLAAVALAGCTGGGDDDGDDVAGSVDKEDVELESGMGAIAGLLVDDRFRPIHLVDVPTTEFQAEGYILVQELGRDVQTNENGEFTVLNIEPGTYTIRADVSGHEMNPRKITVESGLFAEETFEARRISNSAGTILTEERAGFIPCAVGTPAVNVVSPCFDSSGDSYRPGTTVNYEEYLSDDPQETMTYIVIEGKVTESANYNLIARHDDGTSAGGDEYGRYNIEGGDYGKVILQVDEVYDPDMNPNPWDVEKNLNILMFYAGEGEDPVGFQSGIRVDFLISIFLGPPDVDLETYQLFSSS